MFLQTQCQANDGSFESDEANKSTLSLYVKRANVLTNVLILIVCVKYTMLPSVRRNVDDVLIQARP